MPAVRRSTRAARRPRAAAPADPLAKLEFRLVGPFRGGRVGAVAGDPSDRLVFYFGSTGGGVWKTTDGGIYWENVSDKYFRRASVGGGDRAHQRPGWSADADVLGHQRDPKPAQGCER